ncbi:MAG: ABC-type bacteriocin/lantibiotic exporter with double-glycine peptidase domain [Myxococcota bacterium]
MVASEFAVDVIDSDETDIAVQVSQIKSAGASSPRARRASFVAQHNEMDCAAASLETVIRYFGKRAGLARCRDAVHYHREGASLLDIQIGAEALGLQCLGVRAVFEDDFDSLAVPFIVGIDHHFVVVDGRDGDQARLMDPAIGRRTMPLTELTERAQGICLLMAPRPAFAEWEDYQTDHSRYWQLAREHAPQLGRAFGYSLLLLGLGTAGPWLSQFVFDEVIPLRDLGSLAWIAAGYVAVIVLSTLGALARTWVMTRLGFDIDRRLTVALYQRFFSLPSEEFSRRTPGDISATLDEVSAIRQFITGQVMANVLEYLNLIVYVAMLAIIAPELIWLTVAVAPFYAVLPWILGPVVRRIHSLDVNLGARLETILMEQITGYRTLKTMGAEAQAKARWEEHLDGFLMQTLRAERTMYPLNAAVSVFQSLVSVLCLVLAARWVIMGDMSVGAMIAGTQLVSQILGPIASIAEHWTDFQELKVSTERVEEALGQPAEDPGGDRSSAIGGDVALTGVTYRYGRAERPVLDELSVVFRKHEITALVGRSGSGKTTIGQLLNRLLTPQSGTVTVGGFDVRDFPLEALRRSVVVALPEYHLFQGTIMANIALGDPEPADRERAERACRQAQIHSFVAGLPSGYDTRIPESGMGLSSGQKQRLVLARVLYRDPAVLVLDEVTSYLDQTSEKGILEHLRSIRGDKTVIIITHRPNVLAYADRVIVLEDGAIRRDLRTSDPEAQTIFETI